ncbi:MAG TPA: class I SAM-dependent methyltransferase [Saprospiraceae bacterium]|nr:class I SAM-dependent methyltransferase [Saprospiraceae bacterium]HQW55983.1 class I SAM-dependent methyltransferase [Saprospiraceae bacterium]
MEIFDRKGHWENIYLSKELTAASWYQPTPITSLEFFREFNVPLTARIIDIGGGDSLLVDHLLELGYTDLTVLDISSAAIDRAKQRLNPHADRVKWIVSDIATFDPTETYDFWHDRAAFHFLTADHEISNYIKSASNALAPAGILVIGTFSEKGPKKCSGIEIKQYSEATLILRFQDYFRKIKCISVDHMTPFDTIQNFVFCSFRKL